MLHNSAAGIQSDAGAFCVILPGTDTVGNRKLQMVILSFITDADGSFRVSVFRQVGIQIIQCSLQQWEGDLNLTGYRGKL